LVGTGESPAQQQQQQQQGAPAAAGADTGGDAAGLGSGRAAAAAAAGFEVVDALAELSTLQGLYPGVQLSALAHVADVHGVWV
jgi:hypothetical protein